MRFQDYFLFLTLTKLSKSLPVSLVAMTITSPYRRPVIWHNPMFSEISRQINTLVAKLTYPRVQVEPIRQLNIFGSSIWISFKWLPVEVPTDAKIKSQLWRILINYIISEIVMIHMKIIPIMTSDEFGYAI